MLPHLIPEYHSSLRDVVRGSGKEASPSRSLACTRAARATTPRAPRLRCPRQRFLGTLLYMACLQMKCLPGEVEITSRCRAWRGGGHARLCNVTATSLSEHRRPDTERL